MSLAGGPPLLNGRCTSLLRVVVSEMTYTVSSGTLNSTIPYQSSSRFVKELTQEASTTRRYSDCSGMLNDARRNDVTDHTRDYRCVRSVHSTTRVAFRSID